MAVTPLRTTFGGVNTDLPPGRTVSGTADVGLNVVVERGILQKRYGFDQFQANVTGSADAIKNLFVATFAGGDTYVIAKAGGKLWHRKTNANSFTEITGGYTHHATDPGWGFMWKDYFHYCDRSGMTRWNPDKYTSVAKKAGVPQPGTALVCSTTSAAPPWYKSGSYKATYGYKNSETEEEGVVAVLSNGVTCDSSGTILTVDSTTWDAVQASSERDTYANVDQAQFYTTNGAGDLRRAYKEILITVVTNITQLAKPDVQKSLNDFYRNDGGEPPFAAVGCFTGNQQAIYGNIYESATLVPGRLAFSKVGFPCMVPKKVDISVDAGKIDYYEPFPWEGKNNNAIAGQTLNIAYGGGQCYLFTPTHTYRLPDGGYVTPVLIDPVHGADGTMAMCGTRDSVHAINNGTWNRLYGGIKDVAQDRFATLLAQTPAAYRSLTVMAYRSDANQVWAAVTKSTGTAPTRILVLDIDQDAMTYFDLAGLAAGESITAMCEYAYSGAVPTMLVGTSAGRILQYTSASTGDDNAAGTATHFATQWRGYYAQERIFADQKISRLDVHCGDNCAANVQIGIRPMKASGGGETVTQQTATLSKSNKVEPVAMDLTRTTGCFFQVEFSTTSAVTSRWTIHDLCVRVQRTG